MKGKEESFRSVYARTWDAINFLSENDHMAVFDQKVVWLFGFIVVSSGMLYIGMALWNVIEKEHQIEGIWVMFTVAAISLIALIVYLIFLSAHNHEVVEKKTTIAEVQEFYPEVWEIIQGYKDYTLIPEEIAKLDRLAKKDVEPEETEQEDYLALPESSVGLDYEELIKDEIVAGYLEPDRIPTTDEIMADLRRLKGEEEDV